MNCEYISVRKLDYYVNNPNAVIIDLRSREEYAQGHIYNALNVPYDQMEEQLNDMRYNMNRYRGNRNEYREYDKDGLFLDGHLYGREMVFVFYCGRGSLSLSTCTRAAALGYITKSVVGGISQYHGRYLTNPGENKNID